MGVSYIQDDSLIVFVQVEYHHKINGYHRKNIGSNHMAFTVKNNATADVIKASLKQKRLVELYGDKYPYAGGKDHDAFFFEDLDRIKLEIVAEHII